ncbi:MAG: chitobiase/beta-hexosaminidase C-terminal domain-containing protein [Elusimicrobia bacterium]|nr:chitobiase/beta-hexosaminidase C-terminal domain-containing protein [Elusimicrobiota bacterium]
MGKIIRWCMLFAVVIIGLSAISQSAIGPGDIFKEKYIWSTPPAKNYSNAWWRVTDPNPSYTDGPLPYDAPQDFLPNYVQTFSGLDLAGATRAEIVVEMWGGHIGTTGKQFKVNNNSWIPVPENTDISSPECYLSFRYPVVTIPIGQLTSGTNTIEFTAGPQSCGSFNWGQWAYYGLKLRIYYDATKTHPTGSITSPTASSTINDNPAITAAVNTYTGGINRVDFIGYYDDFDEDGNGIYSQWHYRYVVRNGALVGHIGTVTSSPYTKTWDTTWVPDQAASSIKFMAVIAGNDGMCYATPEVAGITLARTTTSVKMYKPTNVPQGFSVTASASPSSKSCSIVIPSNALTITGARMSVVTWNGAEGGLTQSVTLAGTEIATSFPTSTDHDYGYSNITVPTSLITSGTKEFKVTAYHPSNTAWTHGPEIIWPGPVLFVQYNTGGMLPVADPAINPNGGTYSSAQTVSITCATGGAIIKYTTNGSDPSSTNGTVYSGPLTLSSDTTLKAIATKSGNLDSNVVTANFTITAPTTGDPIYFVPVTVAVGSYARYDKPVEVAVNFTQYLTTLGVGGSLNDQSLRVRETDSTGTTVINDSVVFQFDEDSTYNASNNAIGTVTLMMSGTTNASATRYFRIFFDVDPTITKVNFTKQVTLTDNVDDEGQSSYKIETVNATYYYHKQGGGFSSMVDTQNNDWLGYHATGGSAGNYRGIPNMVYPASYFHPGFVNSSSSILNQGPIKIKYKTDSLDGLWSCTWEIFPKYARMTVTKKNSAYWFLYEGTPGGNLDVTGTQDYFYRSNDTSPQLCGSYPSTNILNGDIPAPEWVYFADGTINRSIYLINHQDDTANDSYYQMENNMTVFGFGRTGTTSSLNPVVPAYYTIGFADSRDLTTTKNTIESAWRDLTETIGTPGSSSGPIKVATPQFNLPAGTYSGTQLVIITCGTSGATIKYTKDNTPPLTSGTATSGSSPLVAAITTSGTLRAAAVISGSDDSYENTAAYTITPSASPVGFTKYSSKDGYLSLPGTTGSEYVDSVVLDVDNDGLSDFVIMKRGEAPALVWYKKNGNNWDQKSIDPDVLKLGCFSQPYDIDNDGDLDIVNMGDWNEVQGFWWENPGPQAVGTATRWTKHLIKNTGTVTWHDACFGDFDNDGVAELAAWGRQYGTGVTTLYLWKVPADVKTRTTVWPAPATIYTKTSAPEAEGMAVADIDLDGKVDIVGGGGWFKHVSGTTYTFNSIEPAESAVRGKCAVGQIIKGGRPEVAFSAGDFTGFAAWYESTNAAATTWTKHIIDSNVIQAHSLKIGDLDTDGDNDIFIAEMSRVGANSYPAARMTIYKNDGAASPAFTPTILATGLNNHEDALGDFNGDGRLDILQKSYSDPGNVDNEVAVWIQTGGGKRGLTDWTYKELDTTRAVYGSWYEWFGLAAVDLNNDGYKDLVSGKYSYKNPGGDMTGTWTRTTFPVNVDASLVTDVDGDAYPDVIGFGLTAAYTPNPGVYWLEKTGSGDTTADWTATKVAVIPPTLHSQSQGMRMAQIVPGGREEIVCTGDLPYPGDGASSGKLYYIQIPLVSPQNGNWPVTQISNSVSNSSNNQGIAVGDIDKDGDLDIVGVLGDNKTVVWYENPGVAGQGNWAVHKIGDATPINNVTSADGPDRVQLADLNGDGRLDMILTDEIWDGANPLRAESRTYWFKCPADPKTLWGASTQIVKQQSTNSLDVADMDFDGDKDVVTGEHKGAKETAIWENDGSATPSFTQHIISAGKESHNSAYLSDLDGDGDLDIVSITWDDFFSTTGGLMYILRNNNTFGGGGGNPVVVITKPTNGQQFDQGSNILIEATAVDDVSVAKVEFYNGTTKLGEDTSSPYSYTWNSVPSGDFNIRAVVTDNIGLTGSAQVTISVKNTGQPTLPVGKWDMEGTSGSSTASDTSGYNNNGTLTNMDTATCWVAGKVGTGLKFDGTNDYVSVPNSTSLDINGSQMTLIAWVRIDAIGSASTDNQIFIGKPAVDGSHSSPWFAYSLHGVWNSATQLTPRFWLDIGGSGVSVAATQNIGVDATWHHIAGVYNGATMKIYVDGVESNSSAQTGNIAALGTALRLGANGGGTEPFNGAMDGVKIYNIALTGSEILADKNLTSQPPTVSISTIAITNGSNPPATVRIDATASDSDGTVSKVEFFNGTTKLGEDTSSPYSYTWNTVPTGTYSITATATDNSAATTTTTAQVVTITNGPAMPQQAYPGGVSWSIDTGTTTIQAEDYDMVTSGSAEGEAYHDTEIANKGGATYRTGDGVDVENCTDTGNGYDIGYAMPGEWLEYSVNVNQGGDYKIVLRVASGDTSAGPIHLEFGQHNSTPYRVTPSTSVPLTGGWQTYADIEVSSSVTLTAGNQIMKIVMEAGLAPHCGNFNYIQLTRVSAETPNAVATPTINPGAGTYSDSVTVTLGCATNGAEIRYTTNGNDPTSSSTLYSAPFALNQSATVKARAFKAAMTDSSVNNVAYIVTGTTPNQQAYPSGVAWLIDTGTTTIQAENYDTVTSGSGEGVAYHDTTVANTGDASFRTTEGVDTENCTDIGGGYDIGYIYPGEWLEYSVNVNQSGIYKIVLRAANGDTSASPVHLEFGPHNVVPYLITPSASVPATGGWQTWTDLTLSTGIALNSGNQIMKLVMDTGTGNNNGNFNYINLIKVNADIPNAVATPTISPSAGSYASYVTVTLGCATSGAEIRYTTNGADPTSSSTLYSAPFTLTASATVRARAFKATMTDSSVNSAAYTVTNISPQTSFGNNGNPWQLSVGTTTIEVENYDTVTSGLADGESYYDTTPGNQGGAYRTTEGVDVEAVTNASNGYDIGFVMPGEWLEYSVNVSETADYKIILSVAAGSIGAGPMHIEFGPHNLTPYRVTASVSVPNTGGWNTWTDLEVSSNVTLTAGNQIIKMVMESGSAANCGNFDYIKLIRLSADTTPPVVSAVTPSNVTGSAAVIKWTTNELATSKVEYGLTTSYGSATPVTDTVGVINHSVTLSGLTENTAYHYRMVSVDMNGNTITTGDYSFTTISNDPYPPVISNVVAGVTQNSAVITWTTDENSDSRVAYGTSTAMGTTTTLDPTATRLHSVSISALDKGKTYYYKVYSRDSSNNLAISSQYIFKTYNLKHRIYTYYYDDGTTATKTGASAAASLKFKVQVYNVDENSIATDYTGTVTLTTKNSKSSVLDTTDSTLTGADSGEKEVSIPFRSDINTIELTGDTTAPVVISFSDMYIAKLVGYQGGTIRGANGLKILIPTGVLSANKYLASIKTSSSPEVKNNMKYVDTVNPICYDFGELTFNNNAPVLENQVFTRAVNITIPYTAADIGTLNEDGLRIYYWTGTDWELATGIQTVDKSNNTITATVKHFSTYRILGSYVSADMSNVKVYPNPYNPATAVLGKLKIINLPMNSTMKLFSVTGEIVRELKETDFGNLGWLEWDGKNDNGDKVGKGVYIYQLEDATGSKKTGKIGLIK